MPFLKQNVERKDSEVRESDKVLYQDHDFGPEFELLVTACVALDSEFFTRYHVLVNPESFQDEINFLLVTFVLDYWSEHGTHASKDVLKDLIVRSNIRNRSEVLDRLLSLPQPSGQEYVLKRMVSWSKWNKIKSVVASSMVGSTPEEFLDLINQAGREGDDVFRDYTVVDGDFAAEETGEIVETPWGGVNDALGGGLRVGDLGIVLAFINVGKTTLLVNIARHAAALGHVVVYFTFEDGERKIKNRFQQSISGMTRDQIALNRDKMKRRVSAFFKKTGSSIVVKNLRSRRSTVMDAMSFVRTTQDTLGKKVTVVITDYADRFKPPRRRDEIRHEYTETFEECKFLARELKVVHWTASQIKREKATSDVINIQDVGESIGKAESADVILGVGQTQEDVRIGSMTLTTAKMRDGKKGESFLLAADFGCQRISEEG